MIADGIDATAYAPVRSYCRPAMTLVTWESGQARTGSALYGVEIAVLDEIADQLARARGDDDRVRLGQGLQPCREVRRPTARRGCHSPRHAARTRARRPLPFRASPVRLTCSQPSGERCFSSSSGTASTSRSAAGFDPCRWPGADPRSGRWLSPKRSAALPDARSLSYGSGMATIAFIYPGVFYGYLGEHEDLWGAQDAREVWQ